jgi:hypothetical protein
MFSSGANQFRRQDLQHYEMAPDPRRLMGLGVFGKCAGLSLEVGRMAVNSISSSLIN